MMMINKARLLLRVSSSKCIPCIDKGRLLLVKIRLGHEKGYDLLNSIFSESLSQGSPHGRIPTSRIMYISISYCFFNAFLSFYNNLAYHISQHCWGGMYFTLHHLSRDPFLNAHKNPKI